MESLSVDVKSIQRSLHRAAIALQTHYCNRDGSVYQVNDLQQVLTTWLELSIEELVDDVLFHTVEGDRAYAFNRSAFERQLNRVQPTGVETPLTEFDDTHPPCATPDEGSVAA